MAMHKDGGGDGKSSGIHSTSVPGGRLETSTPPDAFDGLKVPNARGGGKFGGSDTNLSHSLKGTSAVQK